MLTVLVVDDSALMRRALREALEAEGDIRVSVARNGEDALEQVAHLRPDVITLDIHMPVMDGLTCLSHLMLTHPVPVIMVSSLTEKGALATFEALELGAVDYVAKPGGTVSTDLEGVRADLVAKVRAVAGRRDARPAPAVEPTAPPAAPATTGARGDAVVVIGVSTGGPRALETLLPQLPADTGTTFLVVQHMPASFTGVFARRMDGLCRLPVIEVTRPTVLEPDVIHLARGDADMTLSRRARGLSAVPTPAVDDVLWHPSVDRLLASADGLIPPERLIGVLLTGMGDDGAAQLAGWHERGARTIAESESSAVVFGMPRELIERGGASAVLPLDAIGGKLREWLGVAEQKGVACR